MNKNKNTVACLRVRHSCCRKIFSFFSCIAFLFLLFSSRTCAQDPQRTLRNVYKNFQKVKDYTADANVKTEIPFLKMLPINAKVYFKQKDKFKVVSTSIAVLPKQNVDQVYRLFADSASYTAVPQGTEKIGTVTASIISIIPVSDTVDLVLGKFWIDTQRNIILKSQLTTKSNGTILAEYTYGKYTDYGLPDNVVFTVDVKKFKVPKAVAADINDSPASQDDKGKENKKGRIYLTLSNYVINKGIPDEVFKK